MADCLCNAGHTGPPDACSSCKPGTFKNVSGSQPCSLCPAGSLFLAAPVTRLFSLVQALCSLVRPRNGVLKSEDSRADADVLCRDLPILRGQCFGYRLHGLPRWNFVGECGGAKSSSLRRLPPGYVYLACKLTGFGRPQLSIRRIHATVRMCIASTRTCPPEPPGISAFREPGRVLRAARLIARSRRAHHRRPSSRDTAPMMMTLITPRGRRPRR